MFSNQITVSLSTKNIYNRDQVSKAARLGFNTQSVIDAKHVRQFEIGLDKYSEHQDVKFEYKASIQNKENTGNHTEISCTKEEVEVDIVAECQRPQMT